MKWLSQVATRSMFAVLFVGMSQVATADSELGLKNFTQVYQNLLVNFGIDPVPADLKDLYAQVKPRLPQTGRVDDMNSALPVAQLMLAHKVCQVFVKLEAGRAAAERRAFNGIDFNAAPSTLTADQLKTALTNVASLVLMDPLTATQQNELMTRTQKLVTIFGDKPQATSSLTAEMCTMVASSIGALVL